MFRSSLNSLPVLECIIARVSIFIFSALIFSFESWGQSKSERLFRSQQSELPSQIVRTQGNNNNSEFIESDLGLQRPVEVKDKGFGYHLGFSSRIYYTNNAASASSGVGRESAGIWENSLNNFFLLGAFDLGGVAFSPLFSLGYSKFSHFGDDDIDVLDFDTLQFGPNAFFQFDQGWTFRAGIGVMLDFSPNNNMEKTYHQITPILAVGKGFSIGSASSSLELSIAYHVTKSNQIIDDLLDRLEIGFLWATNLQIKQFQISPYLRLAYAGYANQNRDDLLGSFGLETSYLFNDFVSAHLFSGLSFRSSNDELFDFNRLDVGCGARLEAKF